MRASYEIADLSLNAPNCLLKLTKASQIMFSFKSSVGYLSCLLVPPHPKPFLESFEARINICSSNSYVTVLKSISDAKPPHNLIKWAQRWTVFLFKKLQHLFMTSTPKARLAWRRGYRHEKKLHSCGWYSCCAKWRRAKVRNKSGRFSNLKGHPI